LRQNRDHDWRLDRRLTQRNHCRHVGRTHPIRRCLRQENGDRQELPPAGGDGYFPPVLETEEVVFHQALAILGEVLFVVGIPGGRNCWQGTVPAAVEVINVPIEETVAKFRREGSPRVLNANLGPRPTRGPPQIVFDADLRYRGAWRGRHAASGSAARG
jgi:hypothetical protein